MMLNNRVIRAVDDGLALLANLKIQVMSAVGVLRRAAMIWP
jgi:hypothetical protein